MNEKSELVIKTLLSGVVTIIILAFIDIRYLPPTPVWNWTKITTVIILTLIIIIFYKKLKKIIEMEAKNE